MAYEPPPPPPAPGYGPVTQKTNGMAIASLVLGIFAVIFNIVFVPCILAIIFGVVARRQIAASGGVQKGNGMAIAGLILGIIGLAISIIAIIALNNAGTYFG